MCAFVFVFVGELRARSNAAGTRGRGGGWEEKDEGWRIEETVQKQPAAEAAAGVATFVIIAKVLRIYTVNFLCLGSRRLDP